VSPERPPTPGTPDFSGEPDERLPFSVDQVKTDIRKEESDDSLSPPFLFSDHCYSLPPKERPLDDSSLSPPLLDSVPEKPSKVKNNKLLKTVEIKKPKPVIKRPLTPEPVIPRRTYPPRDLAEESLIFYDFLAKGVDEEDISFFHKSYEHLLSADALQMGGYWLNDTHWVEYDATLTDSPPSKKKRKEEPRPHASGSARTEGYYKLDSKEKAKHKSHFARCVTEEAHRAAEAGPSVYLKKSIFFIIQIHIFFSF